MTEEELLKELNRLIEINDYESHKKIIELIDKEINNFKNGEKYKQQYELIKNKSEVFLL